MSSTLSCSIGVESYDVHEIKAEVLARSEQVAFYRALAKLIKHEPRLGHIWSKIS